MQKLFENDIIGEIMLDKKTISVLKSMSKLASGNAYKVVTSDEIISLMGQKSQYDADIIKQIIDFLEKQEYINIKFSEENTYCYSILPKGRITLEQENNKVGYKQEKSKFSIMSYIYVAIASFVGTMLALIIFFLAIV